MFRSAQKIAKRSNERTPAKVELEPYLLFDGQCEEALNFYAGVFQGKIGDINRYEGSPMAEKMKPEDRNRIMHSSFRSATIKFMAADGDPSQPHPKSGNITLALATSDVEEGRRAFEALSAGGIISHPFAKTFWGATFGQCIDRYGIDWLVNAG